VSIGEDIRISRLKVNPDGFSLILIPMKGPTPFF
jgi:hypothetical protein